MKDIVENNFVRLFICNAYLTKINFKIEDIRTERDLAHDSTIRF